MYSYEEILKADPEIAQAITDEMRRQYNALRELTDNAENCTVDADDGLTVHYTLHGQQQAFKVF